MTTNLKFIRRFVLSLACLSLACVGDASAQLQDRAFQFGFVGDTGYSAVGVDEFKRLLTAINRTDLAFVVHVGDFQNDPRGYNPNPAVGAMPCVDERYKDVYDSFQSVRHPFILTPGDNDWTDCVHLQGTQGRTPLRCSRKCAPCSFQKDAASVSAPSRFKVRKLTLRTRNFSKTSAGQLVG